MRSFDHLFPEVALDETRFIVLAASPSAESNLPADTYQLREFFCVEAGCDCRRVVLHVNGLAAGRTLATISFGFDRKAKDAGPYLDPLNPQSQHADELLALVTDVPLSDKSYVARLERHYRMVKEVATEVQPGTDVREQAKVGRNEKCPCGSGKKYKKCCLASGIEPDEEERDEPLAKLSVQEIQKRLKAHGINASREAFLELAEGRNSAWSISDEWARQAAIPVPRSARDFLGLAACELWKRFCPDRPSMEMLGDGIEQGYALLREGERRKACERWLEVWQIVRSNLEPEMRTIESVGDWLFVLAEEIYSEAFEDPSYAVLGARLLEELSVAFPEEDQVDLRCDRGELLFLAGKAQEGARVLLDLIRDFPTTAAGYVRLSDCLKGEGFEDHAREILVAATCAGVTDGDDYDLVSRLEAMGVVASLKR